MNKDCNNLDFLETHNTMNGSLYISIKLKFHREENYQKIPKNFTTN